ncbi:MAG: glycosyltransferase family 39 protein [Aliidongia sp.]
MRRLLPLCAARPALILGLATLALHLWANGGYDYFRDELYFIVCGQHLAWGYVDQPPLVPLIARLARMLFGDSLLGLRLVPALADAALVALSAEAARRLGGGSFARWLAGLAVLAAPVFRVDGLLLSTDSLQPLTWLAAALAIIAATERKRPGAWYALGVLTGIALLDKYMIAFFLAAAGIGLLLTRERRALARPAPWLAGGLALLIVLPNLWWQQSRGWPFLELGAAAAGGKNLTYSPLAWLGQEMLLMSPLTAPIWLAGLAGFATWPRLARMRWLAIAWFVLMAMMLLVHGKPYYPAGIYPILFAGGAVVIEAAIRNGAGRAAIAGVTVLGGLVTLPFALPILPVDDFIAYEQAIGLKPQTGEKQALGALPQYYADMFGWREMAATVGRAYQALPPDDQARAVFFGNNYGEAAAVDLFGGPWRLPPAISGHNSYYLWGPDGHDGSVVLLFSRRSHEAMLEYCDTAEPVGQTDAPHAMPFETGLTLWLCRGSKPPLQERWPALKHYE